MAKNNGELTVVEKYDALIALIEDSDLKDSTIDGITVIDFLTDRKEKSKKSTTAKGPFALNEAQENIMHAVERTLSESNVPLTVTEIIKASADLTEWECSVPKVSSVISKMTINADKNPNPNGIFVRVVDKKSAKYTLVANDNE